MQTERLNIAANVRRLRVAREWSAAILAHRAGLTLRTVRAIEHPTPERGPVQTETLRRLALALDTTTIALRRDPPAHSALSTQHSALSHPELLQVRATSSSFIARLIGFFTNSLTRKDPTP
jgi:transcriptional regulator with XRE-family HTH domain